MLKVKKPRKSKVVIDFFEARERIMAKRWLVMARTLAYREREIRGFELVEKESNASRACR
jgi:hypothetical protein